MIELLVSLLIFAFGMLGIVGMQSKTLGFAQISLYRSQATALSDDILDRMRADRQNAKTGGWDTALTAGSTSLGSATLAQRELQDWKAAVEKLLPNGQASITTSPSTSVSTNTDVTINITWRERDVTQSAWTTTSTL